MSSRGPKQVLAAGLIVLVHGCVLKPEPSPERLQASALANAPIPTAWTAGEPVPDPIQKGWLGKFADPRLQAIVAEALVHNVDLRAAAARVEQAAAQLDVARGGLFPAISVYARTGEQESDASGLEGVIASASWELDLWGRVRYGARGSADEHAATEADYMFARQSLAALVAKSWFLAIEASLQRELANQTVAGAARLVQLAANRRQVGIGSELDVSMSRANLEAYRDSLLQTDLSRLQSLRALELLLGRYPSAETIVASELPPLGPSVPAGLPSELLERRPDVIAAERRVAAAFNRVQQARAARLPAVSLTGSGSDLSSELFVLQDRDNPVWGWSGKVFAPLFSGGALRAQVAMRTAEQRLSMAAYAQAALQAFRDVEEALAAEFAMQRREAVLAGAVAEAARALRFAETRYQVGAGDLRAVQEQLLAWQSARMNLLRVQSERRIQRVNLYLALGGDFGA